MDDRNTGPDPGRNALQTAAEFQPIAMRSMFWRPNYLDHVEKSGWMEHIPFAFWLVEAHRPRVLVELGTHAGTSYFAFCQAVERLGLDTRCFAVDTWKGDEHAGFYDESVFERVRAYNDAQYSGFSRLVRSTFDQALSHFSDHTVDLLHIDGLHSLEAVTHDFQSWMGKLSDRALVVMHDTNVRERGFGVFALFEQLKERYPSFEFVHGHGLGVVGVGPERNEMMRQLFAASGNHGAEREIRDVFARLGRACADAHSARREEQRARELAAQVQQQEKQLVEALQAAEKMRGEMTGRSKELAHAKTRLQGQVEQQALERGQLAERVSILKEARDELKATVQRLQAQADDAVAELDARLRDIEHLTRQAKESAGRIQEVEAALQARDGELVRVSQDRERAVAGLQSQLAEAVTRLRAAQAEHADALSLQLGQLAELKQGLRARDSQLATVESQLGEARQEMAAQQQVQTAEIAALQQRLEASELQWAAREQAQQSELAAARTELAAARTEIEELTRQLAMRHSEAELDSRHDKEIDELRARHKAEIETLQRVREQAEASVKARFAETAKLTSMALALEQQVEVQTAALAVAEAERQALGTQVEGLQQVQEQQDAERERLQQALEDSEAQLRTVLSSRWWRLTAPLRRKERGARKGMSESLAAQADAAAQALAQAEAQAQVEAQAQMLRGSGLFDEAWYLQRYPDVAASHADPVQHYLAFGADERRDPGPRFSTSAYLDRYPDVAMSGVNPLTHFVEYGHKEGRFASGAD